MTAHFVQLLDDLHRRSVRMAVMVEDVFCESCEAAFDLDIRLADRVIRRDEEVDLEEVQVEAETVRIMALFQPVGSDLRLLFAILKVNNDLERIADCAVNIAERTKHLKKDALGNHRNVLQQMSELVRNMLRSAIQAYGAQDAGEAGHAPWQDDAVDALYGECIRHIVGSPAGNPTEIAAALDILSIAKNLERIADHVTNILEDIVFLQTGEIVRHQEKSAEDRAVPRRPEETEA